MGMDRMYRVLAFWLFVMALLFYIGGMPNLAGVFIFQTLLFLILSYFPLSERAYMYIFGGYMVFAFVSMVFWSFFMMG